MILVLLVTVLMSFRRSGEAGAGDESEILEGGTRGAATPSSYSGLCGGYGEVD
jgi:hypothetical protein